MMGRSSGPTIASEIRSSPSSVELAALRLLFGDGYARDFSVELWDGTRIAATQEERFALRFIVPGALRTAFMPPAELSAGRAFAAGLIDVDGDLESAIERLTGAIAALNPLRALRLLRLLRRMPRAALPPLREARLRGRLHSPARDRAAVGFHYDQPVDFYRTFLDRELVYSCAYYDEGVESIEDAQLAKLDYTLRKVRLRPGERLLDIGCGWGALVIRAAQRFGAIALGITLSRKQYEAAKQRVENASLGDRARIELRDYRELRGERFDKIVSIGMFEHVGRSRLPAYFRAAYDALRPGGLFLNHGIADESKTHKGSSRASRFMERFIFPDGELVAVADALRIAERTGFEVRDVENLREHYARTLRAWIANLERNRAAAVAAAGEQNYRAWRLYLAGSAQGFRVGRMGVFQSLLARPRRDGSLELPATRRDLYASSS
jgi:cyclopropane-fatty-acyl-phospholipid synthase